MTGPGSWLVVGLLALAYALCATALARSRHLVGRLLAGTGGLLAAVLLGMAAVNMYFDYYRTWGALWSDVVADNGGGATPAVLPPQAARPRAAAPATPAALPLLRPDPRPGRLLWLALGGPGAGESGRHGLVWLPPQYAEPAYASYRFPVVVLLHGDPGEPSSWTNGLDAPAVLHAQAAAGSAPPVVVVMADVRGAFADQQCLNAPHGPALDDYLSRDLPADLTRVLRVRPPGAGWAVAGLSEGGFCAAHVALRHPQVYGAAGVMDGYFSPVLTRRLYPRGTTRAPAADDPVRLLADLPRGGPLPAFWLMAGTANAPDYRAAVAFAVRVRAREDLRFVTVLHGRHTTPAWRAALPDLLHWAALTASGGHQDGQLQVRA